MSQSQNILQKTMTRHPMWLSGLSLMLGCLTAAIWMTRKVVSGKFHSLDESILQWFQDHRVLELDRRMLELTALGSDTILTLFCFVVMSVLLFQGQHRRAVFVFLCIAGAVIITFTTKENVGRPRPEIVKELMIKPNSDSFPSGHAFVSMTFYLTIAWIAAPTLPTRGGRIYLMVFALLLSIAIGVSRIYLGVHYPTDVLAGWLAGLAWVTACWLLLAILGRSSRKKKKSNDKETGSN